MSSETLVVYSILPLFRAVSDGKLPVLSPECTELLDVSLPATTTFTVDETECARAMLKQLRQDCPSVCADRAAVESLVRENLFNES